MLKFKRILSTLLAACLLLSLLPITSLAVDTSALHNCEVPEGYHLFTDLPTAENPATTADIYWGASFNGVFYGMTGSGFSSGSVATSTDVAAQNKIAILYGGEDETYGTYYYLTYTLPSGAAYTFAYSGGYFSQNALTDGLPSGGFAAKHKLFYDAEQHIFFHRPSADMTVQKALKISASSFKFFTDTAAKVLASGTYPVRLYTTCTSNGIKGNNETHQWSGSCIYEGCETKYDYRERINIVDPAGYHQFDSSKLPTEVGATVDGLYLGAAFEQDGAFYALNAASTVGADGNRVFTTSDVLSEQCTISIRYAGEDETYGDYYNLIFHIPGGASYALAYASGLFNQNKIQEDGLPSGGFAAKHKLYFDADYEFFYVIIETDGGVEKKGLKISAASHSIFKADVPTELQMTAEGYSPVRLFEACVSDNVAGTDDINIWTGACDCGYLFDYQVKPTPASYHVSVNLPTAENPEVTGLSLGGNVNGTFYGMNSISAVGEDSNRYFTTATEAVEQCVITVRYAGNDEVYGDYYNLIFRIPGGDSYAIAYAGGYFNQNKLTDGQPANGWEAKHNLFYDAEGQFFYYIIETAEEVVKKGMKLSTASQKIFTELYEKLKAESAAYVPVRLHEPCVSDNVPGKNAEGKYSGSCACGYKFDLVAYDAISLPGGHHDFVNLPTAENPETTETLHMGLGLVVDGVPTFYGMSGSFNAEHAATTSTDAAAQYTFRILYGGNDATYGDYYYLVYSNLEGTEYAFAYAGGYVSQNKILENGEPTDGWAAKHKMFYDAQLQTFYFRAPADMSVMKGIKISTASFNLFTEKLETLKGDNEVYTIRPYVVCSSNNIPGENDTHHWSGTCSCGFVFDYEDNYVVEGREPQANTPYFWGVTQLDAEGQGTYFFNGGKFTSSLDTQLDMLTATSVYVDVVEGGYNLYYIDGETGEKQYICLGKDAANSYKTYLNVKTDAQEATVYTWNAEYNTLVTNVVKNAEGDTVNMILGAYTSGGTAYTKISAQTLDSMAKDHYFPSHLYVKHMAHQPGGDWQYDAENHWKGCFCGKQSEVAAHEFTPWAMNLNEGIMRRSCDCGYVQEVEVGGELPAFKEASASLHNTFALNFCVKTDAFVTGDYKNPYVVFSLLGEETTVTAYTSKNDTYIFAFEDIAPDLMNEIITATLYATAKDGSTFVLSTQYSVADYCYSVLRAEGTGAELKALMVETLNFGAAAQDYRGNESAPANAELTTEEKALGASGALKLTNVRDFGKNDGSVQWYGASLLMGQSIKIRMYFQADSISGLTVKAGEATYTEETIGAKDGKYYVDYALTPATYGDSISFTVYSGETAVSTTATYSVESYAAVFANRNDVSAEQVALVKALIRYADAAKGYAALDKRTVTETKTLAEGVTKYAIKYDVFGVTTKAYAVVVEADSSAKVMTVAAPWDETNSDTNPVELYTAYEYKNQLKNQGYNVLAITNGGFFHKSAGSNLPWGMQIVGGEVLQAPSKESLAYSDNWFGVTKDGEYVISNTDGYYANYEGNIAYGIGGGKLMMKDGVAQNLSGQDSYRTCVGLTDDGDLIILCIETCTYEMAVRAFEDLNMGVTTILNMDGGGSTTLYTTDSSWVSRYDICGDGWWPREIADAIAIVAG